MVVPFTGNDAQRVARVLTSEENRKLRPLERALGYARLRAFGWDNARIAQDVHRTVNHVAQLLQLADAPSKVQAMVSAGQLAADEAVKVVRDHGEEKATQVLDEAMQRAKAMGKTKVTGAVLRDKPLPPKVVSGLVGSVDTFMESLSTETRTRLTTLEGDLKKEGDWPFPRKIEVDAAALLALLQAHAAVGVARQRAAESQRSKEAKAAQASLPED
ncbi:ParB/RepB/Spo0J family partition protein [Cupriavidus pauculus]|uniref:ParB/RepB/Spo0J family partition protein n=1 Tax=Cupriavidus pauculus TaxID=82633 RepID=UPI003857BB5A